MGDWKEYKLGELFSVPLRNGLNKPSRVRGHGYRMINMKEIFGYDFIGDETPMELVPLEEREKDFLINGDLLFARQSLVASGAGKISYYRGSLPTVFESHLIRCRINKEIANARYVYYLIKSPYGRSKIDTIVEQTAAAGIRGSDLKELRFNIPNLPTQITIAEILSSFDDKIELNNKINHELETLAQTLFKRWFVDFEFPNENGEPYKSSGGEMVESELGEISKGWRVASIDEISEKVGMGPFGANIKVETFVDDGIPIISGQHLKGTILVDKDYNFITDSHARKLKNSIVKFGDVIFTHAGNIGQVAYIPSSSRYKEYIISQRQFFLRPKNEIASGLFLTLFFKSSTGQSRLLANTSSTGVPSISRPVTYIRSIKVVIPTPEIMNLFTQVVTSIYDLIAANIIENNSISNIRDTLLPKLISGELEVSQAQPIS